MTTHRTSIPDPRQPPDAATWAAAVDAGWHATDPTTQISKREIDLLLRAAYAVLNEES